MPLIKLFSILTLICIETKNFNINSSDRMYTYVYSCTLQAYVSMDNLYSGRCYPYSSHPCSYQLNKKIGAIATEKAIKAMNGIPSLHNGCYQIP